jgi:hypothetical protein
LRRERREHRWNLSLYARCSLFWCVP